MYRERQRPLPYLAGDDDFSWRKSKQPSQATPASNFIPSPHLRERVGRFPSCQQIFQMIIENMSAATTHNRTFPLISQYLITPTNTLPLKEGLCSPGIRSIVIQQRLQILSGGVSLRYESRRNTVTTPRIWLFHACTRTARSHPNQTEIDSV